MPDERREQGLSYADKFLYLICIQGNFFSKTVQKEKLLSFVGEKLTCL